MPTPKGFRETVGDLYDRVPVSQPAKSILCFGIAAVVVLWLITPLIILTIANKSDVAGQFGDLYGAINALFSGLAFVGVLTAIVLQHQEMVEAKAQVQQGRAIEKTIEFCDNWNSTDFEIKKESAIRFLRSVVEPGANSDRGDSIFATRVTDELLKCKKLADVQLIDVRLLQSLMERERLEKWIDYIEAAHPHSLAMNDRYSFDELVGLRALLA
jgi:hypothetical protein